jgi:hypothetical protein
MRDAKKIVVAATTLILLSCSGGGDDISDQLTMDIGKSSAVLIPAPATTLGCDQIARQQTTTTGSITGAYFTLPNPNISWGISDPVKPSEVRILALKFTLKSPKIGGEYSCLFSDIALGSLFYSTSGLGDNIIVNTWDSKLGEKSAKGKNSTRAMVTDGLSTPCDIKCGGVSVPKGAGLFSVSGVWELSAVRKQYASANANETNYEETPISVTGTFSVENVLK